MRTFKTCLVVVCLAAAGWAYLIGPQHLRDLGRLVYGTPHERYTAWLRYAATGRTPQGRAWLEAAEQSLQEPVTVALPITTALGVSSGRAAAFAVPLRRGERYRISIRPAGGAAADELFVDLFRRAESGVAHVASAGSQERGLDVEIRRDGTYVLRLQRRLDTAGSPAVANRDATLTLAAEPTLRLPVHRATRRSIQSFFGATRDGGRRAHHGIDIFAARGARVLAASSGVVVSVGTNALGGNVVWIARPGHGERHYYAHLDRQLVSAGTVVRAGDVIGTVGNTGNARTTRPHLHFGIYAASGAVDPLPYVDPVSGRSARPVEARAGAATRAR